MGQGATAAHMYVPRGIPRGERLPLVVFLHGYQAVEEFYYVAWIEHLVKRGAVVLYPRGNTGLHGWARSRATR